MSRFPIVLVAGGFAMLALGGCRDTHTPTPPGSDPVAQPAPQAPANPFERESELAFGYPRFDLIRDEHFAPALERGMAEHREEVAVIAGNQDAPTFDNTIVALERSRRMLDRTERVFNNLAGVNSNDTIRKVQADMAPRLAAHRDSVLLDETLFGRVNTLYEQRQQLGLDAEQLQLLERYHLDFVRAGARLSAADKSKLKDLNAELAGLQTRFTQNVLAETNASAVMFDSRDELAGLSDAAINAAAKAAEESGNAGKFQLRLQNTTGQPALADLDNRESRQKLLEASLRRGSRDGQHDNRELVEQIVKLRAERARLLGYPSHAAYVLEDNTAGTVEAVNKMLGQLAPAAVANARREAADIQAIIDAEGGNFQLAPWDWAYYSQKVMREKYDLDENALKPYFELDRVLVDGVFFAATKLYGITFRERTDLPVYHPDVRVWEVFDVDGSSLALFVTDMYARPSKRGGAWMNAYVAQNRLLGQKPVIGNHLNIPKPADGAPTLMTFSEVTTLFHEFGHALHGMFSDVNYPLFAGTAVPRDFVEFPSQVNEMWATWPEVLANYARHHQTGEMLPKDLLDRLLAAETFNQGFATTEYLASAMLDQAFHQIGPEQVPDDVIAFERDALARIGLDFEPVPPRYRTGYFSHTFSGGYSAGYYAYIWSEVLDAESVRWFQDNGGLNRENGDHFRSTLLSRGGSQPAMAQFQAFAGREPGLEPLLVRRGLAGDDARAD